jgi:hypothetical protein
LRILDCSNGLHRSKALRKKVKVRSREDVNRYYCANTMHLPFEGRAAISARIRT